MKYLILSLLICLSLISYSQDRILADGIFSEWTEYPIIYTDVSGDEGFSNIDFQELQITNDADFIFFSIEIGTELNLQDGNNITIYIDTDDNVNSGFFINGIGAELVYNFGDRNGAFYTSSGSTTIFHDDVGLVSAPTVTSDRFEIAFKRNISVSGTAVFQSDKVKVVFEDDTSNGDILPASDEVVEYEFSDSGMGSLPSYSIKKSSTSDLRIMSYNALNDGLFDQSRIASFIRVLQATQPDIIGFEEIYDASSAQVASKIEEILPSSSGQQWYHAMEGPDCHAISRYPIIESAKINGNNSGSGNGAFLIEIPEVEGDLLLIVAHPPCCDNNSGRQKEVDLIMEFIREAKAGNGPISLAAESPIVIVGDMNFVGDHRQVETLLTGDISNENAYGPDFAPDWDGNDFLDSHPYSTEVPFSYTWYQTGSSFSPGRLDYIIYSGSNLALQNSYSLFTPSLPQDSLTSYNMLSSDVLIASDHLPIVADFGFKKLVALEDQPKEQNFGILNVAPNPASGITDISFETKQKGIVLIELVDPHGKVMSKFQDQIVNPGKHTLQCNVSAFPAGVYIIKMTNSSSSYSRKIIIE